ncbi:MAG: hypothetical protein ACKPKO_08625, partial [Candidatus Fonsibacter sp.]
MEKIREYVRNGCAPFFFKKGLVEPWDPVNRWASPLYTAIKDSPEPEPIIWLAKQVDEIEQSGRTKMMWTEGGVLNPFRDRILDENCVNFFGKWDPTDWDIKDDYQS